MAKFRYFSTHFGFERALSLSFRALAYKPLVTLKK
jgi:hypothetical protein